MSQQVLEGPLLQPKRAFFIYGGDVRIDVQADTYDVTYQGVPGAYSEAAAVALLGESATMLPARGLEQVFSAVAARRARRGVVPLENTIAGTVPDVYELLLAFDLRMVAETCVRVDHALIGPEGVRREDLRRVFSHPVALGQCRTFLRANPHIEPVAVFDTAGAVDLVMRERDGVTAAIASVRAAHVYGGQVLAEHLQDHPENWTRFALLARHDAAPRSSGASRMLLAFDLSHTPGALVRALQPIADHDVNLTKIESRPLPQKPFEYRFIVELATVRGRDSLDEAREEMRSRTVWLRVLGTYDEPAPHNGGL